jgi:hypothetical protein
VSDGWKASHSYDEKYHDEEWLTEQYVHKGKSTLEIGEDVGADPQTIHRWLKQHDIPIRISCKEKPPQFFTSEKGREKIRTEVQTEDGRYQPTVFVHQLIAISDGADPHKVFSRGEYHVHHKNRNSWDNRPSNLEFVSRAEHEMIHRTK